MQLGFNQKDKYCVVQIAPAVRVAIGEGFGLESGELLTKKIYAALRRLGFKGIFDTSYGADVTIMEEASEFIERFIHKKGPLPLITSCCPSWVDFMEKFEPEMIPHFSSVIHENYCSSQLTVHLLNNMGVWDEGLGSIQELQILK